MKLKVVVDDVEIDIVVGKGEQKIKWLGLVAAQRYVMERQPRGRLRGREEPESMPMGNFMLPTDVLFEGESLSPEKVINQVLKDGDTIKVPLQREVLLDEINMPIQTEWQENAFWRTGSEASKVRQRGIESRERIKKEEQRIQDEILRRQKESARHKLAKEKAQTPQFFQQEQPTTTKARAVIVGHLTTPEDRSVALELDWPRIEGSLTALRCPPLNRWDIRAMKDVLKDKYRELNAVFARYAGVGRIGDPNGMTLLELGHFVHVAKLARFVDRADPCADRRLISGLFDSATKSRFSSPPPTTTTTTSLLLTRAEFVAVLIALVFATPQPIEEDDEDEKDDRRGSHSKARKPETLVKALEILVKSHIPAFLNTRRGVFVDAFDSIPIQDAIQHSRSHLLRVFRHYIKPKEESKEDWDIRESKDDDAATKGGAPLDGLFGRGIAIDGFKRILHDSGILELIFTEDNATEKANKIALDAFLAVQNDPTLNEELEDLVFIEIIEAYSRVATDMLDSNDIQSKILLGLDRLCELSLSL